MKHNENFALRFISREEKGWRVKAVFDVWKIKLHTRMVFIMFENSLNKILTDNQRKKVVLTKVRKNSLKVKLKWNKNVEWIVILIWMSEGRTKSNNTHSVFPLLAALTTWNQPEIGMCRIGLSQSLLKMSKRLVRYFVSYIYLSMANNPLGQLSFQIWEII